MNIIKPKIFADYPRISAGFTTANRDSVNSDGKIPGLNVGDNTDTSFEEVELNIKRLMKFNSWDPESIALAKQIHGNSAITISKPGFYNDVDSLVTTKKEVTLGIKTADCAAVLLADPDSAIIAAAHAGWRGAVAGIVPNTIEKMVSGGAKEDKILVYVSPCLSLESFEVGPEVANQFPRQFVDHDNYKKPHVDLKGFLADQMVKSGISSNSIEIASECTLTNSQYYSFRRERERAGRMLGYIRILES